MNLKFTVAQDEDYHYNGKELTIGIDGDRKPYFGIGRDDYIEVVVVEEKDLNQIIRVLETVKSLLKREDQ